MAGRTVRIFAWKSWKCCFPDLGIGFLLLALHVLCDNLCQKAYNKLYTRPVLLVLSDMLEISLTFRQDDIPRMRLGLACSVPSECRGYSLWSLLVPALCPKVQQCAVLSLSLFQALGSCKQKASTMDQKIEHDPPRSRSPGPADSTVQHTPTYNSVRILARVCQGG